MKTNKISLPRVFTFTPPTERRDYLKNLKEILVPLDFSTSSQKALKYAVAFAERFGGVLNLLYVVEKVAYPNFLPLTMENKRVIQEAKETTRAKLMAMYEKASQNPRILKNTMVRNGNPSEEIVAAAKDLNADMIIISTHGWTGLKHALLGSTTERVVRHAKCPVLVVRQNEKDFV